MSATINTIPAELLIKILLFAAQFDNPKALENPLIDWRPTTPILFKRTSTLRRASLATKAAIARVCYHWNTLITPVLYEHAWIDNEHQLAALTTTLTSSNSRHTNLAAFVKRLDVELDVPKHPTLHNSIARLLASVPDLTTLVMLSPNSNGALVLLYAIPPRLKHLYWKAPRANYATSFLRVADTVLFNFLETHPEVETISFPISFEMASHRFTEPLPPFPSVRTWILITGHHLVDITLFAVYLSMFPNMHSRITTWEIDSLPDIMITTSGQSRHAAQVREDYTSQNFAPNPDLTTLAFVEQYPDFFPIDSLSSKLFIAQDQCPNLRHLHLTVLIQPGNNNFQLPPINNPLGPKPILPQVTTLSIQRTATPDLADPVATLHHMVRLPWKLIFPELRTIRIDEDVDLGNASLRHHPVFAYAKEMHGKIRIEDRFGESLVQS